MFASQLSQHNGSDSPVNVVLGRQRISFARVLLGPGRLHNCRTVAFDESDNSRGISFLRYSAMRVCGAHDLRGVTSRSFDSSMRSTSEKPG